MSTHKNRSFLKKGGKERRRQGDTHCSLFSIVRTPQSLQASYYAEIVAEENFVSKEVDTFENCRRNQMDASRIDSTNRDKRVALTTCSDQFPEGG